MDTSKFRVVRMGGYDKQDVQAYVEDMKSKIDALEKKVKMLEEDNERLEFKLRKAGGGSSAEDEQAKAKVWTLEGNVFKAHAVQVGTTNGMLTEITGGINEGTEVLVDFTLSGDDTPEGQQAQNPFMPRPRQNNRNQQGGQQPKR